MSLNILQEKDCTVGLEPIDTQNEPQKKFLKIKLLCHNPYNNYREFNKLYIPIFRTLNLIQETIVMVKSVAMLRPGFLMVSRWLVATNE